MWPTFVVDDLHLCRQWWVRGVGPPCLADSSLSWALTLIKQRWVYSIGDHPSCRNGLLYANVHHPVQFMGPASAHRRTTCSKRAMEQTWYVPILIKVSWHVGCTERCERRWKTQLRLLSVLQRVLAYSVCYNSVYVYCFWMLNTIAYKRLRMRRTLLRMRRTQALTEFHRLSLLGLHIKAYFWYSTIIPEDHKAFCG